MIELRLVLDVQTWSWGSEGLELKEKYYILQVREASALNDLPWKTCPIKMWKDLTEIEQKEMMDALSP